MAITDKNPRPLISTEEDVAARVQTIGRRHEVPTTAPTDGLGESMAGFTMSRQPDHDEALFESGLARAVVLGGVAGFFVVLALSTAAFFFLTPYGLFPSLGASVFVGAFGGFGFGAMVAASVYH